MSSIGSFLISTNNSSDSFNFWGFGQTDEWILLPRSVAETGCVRIYRQKRRLLTEIVMNLQRKTRNGDLGAKLYIYSGEWIRLGSDRDLFLKITAIISKGSPSPGSRAFNVWGSRSPIVAFWSKSKSGQPLKRKIHNGL